MRRLGRQECSIMGCFTFKCKRSGKSAMSDSFNGDRVHLYLLKNGKVLESMHGNYDSYGRVFDSRGESMEWKMPWGEVCELMFNNSAGDGIALVLDSVHDSNDYPPTTQSQQCGSQGWGRITDGALHPSPHHIVFD